MIEKQTVTEEFQQTIYDFLEGLKDDLSFSEVQKGKDHIALASVPKLHTDPSVDSILCICKNCDYMLTIALKNICIPHTSESYVETAVIDTYLHEKIGDIKDVTSPEFVSLYNVICGSLRRPRTSIDILRLIALRNNGGLTRIVENGHGNFTVIIDIPCDYIKFPKDDVESAIRTILARGARFAEADYLLRQYLLPGLKSRNHDFQHLLNRILSLEEELESISRDDTPIQEEQDVTI